MLTTANWEHSLRTAWERLRDRVEMDRDLDFGHEHTLQFHFAWEVARLHDFSDELEVRFEVLCGQDSHGEVIRTDLIFWTDPRFKIAVEMKAPIRSESRKNSAMTYFRMAFYRDIDRLRHLAETEGNGIQRGMFLAVVNERGYVVQRRQTVNQPYATYHGIRIKAGSTITPCPGPNGCDYPLIMPGNPIRWSWSCEMENGKVVPLRGMKHFWLEPIVAHPRSRERRWGRV